MIQVDIKERTISANIKTPKVDSKVVTPKVKVSGDTKRVPEDVPVYDGTYVVDPKAFKETILPTNGKLLEDDIKVRKVPYYKTSNLTGETVYIAMEV